MENLKASVIQYMLQVKYMGSVQVAEHHFWHWSDKNTFVDSKVKFIVEQRICKGIFFPTLTGQSGCIGSVSKVIALQQSLHAQWKPEGSALRRSLPALARHTQGDHWLQEWPAVACISVCRL